MCTYFNFKQLKYQLIALKISINKKLLKLAQYFTITEKLLGSNAYNIIPIFDKKV